MHQFRGHYDKNKNKEFKRSVKKLQSIVQKHKQKTTNLLWSFKYID